MAIPDDGPTTPGGEWAFEGKDLKADPGTMRGYGKNIATVGQNLQDDMMGGVTKVQGGGKDTTLSTGGFAEGQYASQLASRNGEELMKFIQDALQSTQAISSVAHICADLYEGSDKENGVKLGGVEWGFAMTDKQPPGVPPWLKDKTLDDMREEADEKKDEQRKAGDEKLVTSYSVGGEMHYLYKSEDGTTRSVVKSGNEFTETGYAKDGTTVLYTISGDKNSHTSTQYENGKPVGTTKRTLTETTQGNVTTRKAVTVQDSGSGPKNKTIETTETRRYDDQTETRNYTTDTQQQKQDGSWGEQKRTDERYVGAQPKPRSPEDIAKDNEELLKKTRDQARGM